MPSKNNADYWKIRALELEEAQHQAAADFNTLWDAEYQKAAERLQKDFEYWYNRVAESDGISMAEARKLLSADELAEFHWSLAEFTAKAQANGDLQWEKQLVHASAKQHISRLEQEQIQLQNAVKDLFADRQSSTANFLGDTYSDAYLHSHFNIQQHTGKGYIPRPIDTASLEKALSKPWTADGKTFSGRIWADQQKLTAELQTVLSQGLVRGDSPLIMSKELAHRMSISQSNAARLVYTESAVFRERGSLEAMKSRGAKTLEIIATLDSGTCSECGSMDGKKVDMKDAEVGVTIPTFHPRCRCTSAAYDPDFAEFEGENRRAARDGEGETFTVPANMTYEEWKKALTNPPSGDTIKPRKASPHLRPQPRGQRRRPLRGTCWGYPM